MTTAVLLFSLSLAFRQIKKSLVCSCDSYLSSSSLEKLRKGFYSDLHLDSALSFTDEEKDLANVSRLAAWKAGKVMVDEINNAEKDITSKIGSRDIVTKVDKEAQDIIKSTILSYFPNHKFLGEEDIPPGKEASSKAIEELKHEKHLWIVDPVDGTTNYSHTMPMAAVIIAYASYGKVKHGFIYDPFRKESFFSWEGKGSFLNGERIHCDQINSLELSLLGTGSPPAIDSLNASLRVLNHLSSQVQSMRILGSAAFMLMYVANGRLTGYVEADLNAWDIAAGSLLIKEAGGKVTDVWGNNVELTTRNVVATNGLIHDSLLKELKIAKAWI
jgi:myo-inositol-1(or 4)-monophosphatase